MITLCYDHAKNLEWTGGGRQWYWGRSWTDRTGNHQVTKCQQCDHAGQMYLFTDVESLTDIPPWPAQKKQYKFLDDLLEKEEAKDDSVRVLSRKILEYRRKTANS